jgi:hypothetical protein
MSIESFFEKVSSDFTNLFKVHGSQIKSGIADAHEAIGAAISIATVLGEPKSVTDMLGKVSDGLGLISTAVDGETNATTLTAQVAAANTLVTGLVNSGDIGVKNKQTQFQIAAVGNKIQGVANVISSALASATTVPVSSATT